MLKTILRKALPPLALSILGLIAFLNSLPNSFHFDDYPTIVQNGAIRNLKLVPSYFVDTTTWTISQLRDWRPVVLTTFALNYWMGGTDPVIFRLSNLALHIATSFFLVLILGDILSRPAARITLASARAATGLALSAGALFLVHTANSEVVNYIFARSTLLATFFYAGAFYCYLRGPFCESRTYSGLWQVGGLSAFALGLASKATIITLPINLMFFEIIFLNPSGRKPWQLYREEPHRLKKYFIPAVLCACYVGIRQVLAPRALAQFAGTAQLSPYVYLLTQFRAWVYYMSLFIWPEQLVSDYPGFGWSYSLWDRKVLLSLSLVLSVLAIAWFLCKRQRVISFFLLWYFVTLLPEASIVPLSDAVNGYRFYPSNLGLTSVAIICFMEFACWLDHKITGKNNHKLATGIGTACLTVALGSLILSTVERNEVFRDDGTFWSDILSKDPADVRAYLGLGSFFLDEQRYGEARQLFDKAVEMAPRNGLAYLFRGHLKATLLRYDESLRDYKLAAQFNPRDPFLFLFRGEAYRNLKQYNEALSDYDEALRLRPYYTAVHFAKATALQEIGEDQKAYETCEQGIKIDPDQPDFYLCLGRLLTKQSRIKETLQLYQTAASRGLPSHDLWYELGLTYQKVGNYSDAIEAFNKATRLMGPAPHQARPNLYPSQQLD
jgi:tetratricopeptide (TPR) repeat protein